MYTKQELRRINRELVHRFIKETEKLLKIETQTDLNTQTKKSIRGIHESFDEFRE